MQLHLLISTMQSADSMLLLYPPLAKPCEAPAGIAQLAGTLRGNGLSCTLIDCNLEGIQNLLSHSQNANDTWSKRAKKNKERNLQALRSTALYSNPARYAKAVSEINRLLENSGKHFGLSLSLANYQEATLSPLKSDHLLKAAKNHEKNIFFPYFSDRLEKEISAQSYETVGISLNYLSQALTCFAMIGFLKKTFPDLSIIVGGGLLTSWMRNPDWKNPFGDLIDHLISGPGEAPLLHLAGIEKKRHHIADYQGLPLAKYFSPGTILPYAASSGCYWNKCSFCPETTEDNPYCCTPPQQVLADISQQVKKTQPALIHFLDNALAPSVMKAIVQAKLSTPWYGFARVSPILMDVDFCRKLRESGCVMLKLGIESGDQTVLDNMNKGIDLDMVSQTLKTLHQCGISTYVYLLFGTPQETIEEARKTLSFVVNHHTFITFLNLAIFNMPIQSKESSSVKVDNFYQGDLSLYTNFVHSRGWNRQNIRRFLDQEFKRHPLIAEILRRDPPIFTSNHAPFFVDTP